MPDQSANVFRTTHWTQVLAARGESSDARQALSKLCEAYYGPVETFVRRYRQGHDDARDLTQAFFARLLEGDSLAGLDRTRGRFRSYLLGAVKHFLADQQDRALAEKRGGGQSPRSLNEPIGGSDGEDGGLDPADPQGFPPDAFFDHHWALAIVEEAMSALRAESEERNEIARFEVLKQSLVASDDRGEAQAAARALDMTDGAFKVAVHRLRKRFRQIVKAQIAATVDDPAALDDELGYLIQALVAK